MSVNSKKPKKRNKGWGMGKTSTDTYVHEDTMMKPSISHSNLKLIEN